MTELNDQFDDPKSQKAQRIASLIAKYLKKDITPQEHDELDEWVGASDENMQLFEELTDEKKLQEALTWLNQVSSERTLNRIKSQLTFTKYYSPRPLFSRKWHYAAAACLLAVMAVTAFLIYKKEPVKTVEQVIAETTASPKDLQPGSNDKAILTLDDGKTIILDEAQNGKLASQGASDIIKNDGQLNYSNSKAIEASLSVLYNTVTTPRGGNYALTLSDGTRIWLNAASSIRFPAVFNGQERRVAITGEVYFEVAKSTNAGKRVPFIVDVRDKGTSVEVLGTHFNINAYNDEAVVKTTLLEGAVKVAKDGNASLLKPGQQAQVSENGDIKTVSGVDTDLIMAWKNGMFRFSNTDLKSIMKQMSRWYDVDIVYETNNNPSYSGLLSKNLPASKMFEVLEETGGVHFKIEGKKIVVLP